MTTSDITLASRIASVSPKSNRPAEEGRPSAKGPSFAEVLAESLQKVNHLQQEADEAIQGLTTTSCPDVAQTMAAVQKASLSFQMMTQVRNKLVQAYEEVMQTPS